MPRRGKVIPFPGVRLPEPRVEPALVEVHRCDHAEAVVVRSLLESEGLPIVARSRVTHSVHPFTVGAQGEVVVLVPAALVARARAILTRRAAGDAP